jgi:DNA-directed RNA polymerase specialized sigma24 family protein
MSGYASFEATHEERLVRSLVAETRLPRARATLVAREVLACAWERGVTFPDGAAYGWLRVAARHRAADPSSAWADAADAAVAQAHEAAEAIATLAPSERELLRLRYVDGLLPAAIADRLGTTVADVRARLDAARSGTARRLAARHGLVPYVRPFAVAALAAAAAATLFSPAARTSPLRPPVVAGGPSYVLPRAGSEPLDASSHAPLPVQAVGGDRMNAAYDATTVAVPYAPPPPRHPCRLSRTCLPGDDVGPDTLVVPLPKQVGDKTGKPEVTVPLTDVPVRVCEKMPDAPPGGVVRCERGSGSA